MHASTYSGTIDGVQGLLVRVEVHLAPRSLRAFRTVGLPNTEVRESRERVRAAIESSRLVFPKGRITVNLAPADVKKQGAALDLAVALSILACSGQLATTRLAECLLLGELALDGRLRSVRGTLPAALAASNSGLHTALVPWDNLGEARLVEQLDSHPVGSLSEALELLRAETLPSPPPHEVPSAPIRGATDFKDIKAQHQAKRAIEIAAAGGHNLLMNGPPGAGKTLMAKAVTGILPPLSKREAIEVATIHSSSGFAVQQFPRVPPLRAPHHSISYAAMAGGGTFVRPGEVSLAHRGVLFLDELAEFPRRVVEVLRQPLEEGHIAIHRVQHRLTLPARFMLLAATNPCPCGHYESDSQHCRCPLQRVLQYQAKLSGPLLDRMDLLVHVRALDPEELLEKPRSEESSAIRSRVIEARERQYDRAARGRRKSQCYDPRREGGASRDHGVEGAHEFEYLNGSMHAATTEAICTLTDDAQSLLSRAVRTRRITARGYHRLLRVARTIADLDGNEKIQAPHLAEAIQFRRASDQGIEASEP